MEIFFKTTLPMIVAAAIALSATSALANTAANTEIVNKARLTYSGGTPAESSSIVTVGLVPSTPNVEITRNDAVYTGVGAASMVNTVTITATANGPAAYTVAPSVTASTNTQPGPAVLPGIAGGATVTIGASVTTGTSGTTWVTVPASGASGAAPAAINGIAVGNTIVFTTASGTYSRDVTSFTDNGDGTYRINFTTAVATAAVAGNQVGQRYQVTLTATPGTITTLGTDLTTTVQAVVSTPAASFGGAPAPTNATVATAPANKWTSTSATISFQKYSRNVYNAAGNTGGIGAYSYTIKAASGAHNYYTGNVTGVPGDTIEYLIKATNSGGAAINGCVISDVLPVAYVNDPLTVVDYNNFKLYYKDETNTVNNQNFGGGALANYASPNLSINVGTGATNAAAGSIPAGLGVVVGYQVTIR